MTLSVALLLCLWSWVVFLMCLLNRLIDLMEHKLSRLLMLNETAASDVDFNGEVIPPEIFFDADKLESSSVLLLFPTISLIASICQRHYTESFS
ncbi:hypothetical protein R1sor_004886 [Riccia sorocarpa]|uniref:ATP synthase F0 subunit 8 n=1 Tax=Riccia sorocarpa TaxID=122646 RepID=A0ABD3HMC2_9MARC